MAANSITNRPLKSIANFTSQVSSACPRLMRKRVVAVCVHAWCVYLQVRARGMPPQPHPPVAVGALLRPRPARQSPDCRRGRVHRQASRRLKRVRLKAAAFPAQHIRSALSQSVAGGAAHRRPRRIPAGRRGRMRRGLPSPGSVGIPPVAGPAASRLPPSASPAVTASASCRRPSSPLRTSLAPMTMRVAFATDTS